MWVESALINRDSQKTDLQIQLLDYLDPSFWGDELRRVQLTTYEDFRALNSVKTRESIEPIPVQQEKQVQDDIKLGDNTGNSQPILTSNVADVWQTPCLVCDCFLSIKKLYILFHASYHCIIQVNSLVFPFLFIFVSLFTELRTSWRCDIAIYRRQVDKTWEEDTKIVSSILVPLLTALLA